MRNDDRTDCRILPFRNQHPSLEGGTRRMHPQLTLIESGANVRADRTIVAQRTGRSKDTKEPTLMSAYLGLNHIQAESRRQDLLAEASHLRLVSEVARSRSDRGGSAGRLGVVRRSVGLALVRVGQRLHGAGAGAAIDAAPGVGTLRTAR